MRGTQRGTTASGVFEETRRPRQARLGLDVIDPHPEPFNGGFDPIIRDHVARKNAERPTQKTLVMSDRQIDAVRRWVTDKSRRILARRTPSHITC
jgi:hypothetical protein